MNLLMGGKERRPPQDLCFQLKNVRSWLVLLLHLFDFPDKVTEKIWVTRPIIIQTICPIFLHSLHLFTHWDVTPDCFVSAPDSSQRCLCISILWAAEWQQTAKLINSKQGENNCSVPGQRQTWNAHLIKTQQCLLWLQSCRNGQF